MRRDRNTVPTVFSWAMAGHGHGLRLFTAVSAHSAIVLLIFVVFLGVFATFPHHGG